MNGEREDSQSNKYQPPPNFKEVSVSYEHSGLTADNLKDSHELWIIKLPKETDISTLVGAKFELGEKITITTEESEPLTCISSDLNCQDKYSLLLPSKKQGSFLSVPHRFAGKLDLAPSVNVIDSTEVNLSEGEEVDALQTYPEEIKQRFAPFGSVDFRDDFNSRKSPKKIKSPKTNSSKKKDMNSDLKDSERSTSSWGQDFLEKISGKKERKRHSDFSESPEKKKKRRHSEKEKTRTESPTKSSNFEDTSIKIENDSLQNSSPKKKKHSKKHKRKKSSDESSS